MAGHRVTPAGHDTAADSSAEVISELRRRIREHWEAFSPAARSVCRALSERSAEQLVFVSAAELGAETKTSNATVVRTVQALGYSGLAELKAKLAAPIAGNRISGVKDGAIRAMNGPTPVGPDLAYAMATG